MPDASSPEILHYLGCDHDNGGIVSIVQTLANERRFTCVLGVAPGFVAKRERPLPTVVLPAMPAEHLGLKTFWQARAVATSAERWLAAWPERVVHAHTRGGLAVALWLRKRGQKRVVASVHCYGKQRWFYRWAGRQMGEQLFWLTPAMKNYYRVKTPGRDEWAQCIPGCVPLTAAPAERAHREGDVLRVGGIGALVSWKCWHLVLDALSLMPAKQRWKMRFEHIGGPDAAEKSQRYALAVRTQTGALSLGNLVMWRGPEPSPERLLREIDVLVVPSRREPFSIAMLEALAAGVPVLAASSGGARDAVVSTKNGWFFRSGDPKDLARAFVMLIESDALRTVRPALEPDSRFAAPRVAAQWAEVYARQLSVK